MKKVLFVCIHNSGRSQMAEAFAKMLSSGTIMAESAGTEPGGHLNPQVVEVMEEIGYDMSANYPKLMTPEMVESADKVVTMGCGVNLDDIKYGEVVCPAVFVKSEDWGLEDPNGQPIDKVRDIRDLVKARVERLIEEIMVDEG